MPLMRFDPKSFTIWKVFNDSTDHTLHSPGGHKIATSGHYLEVKIIFFAFCKLHKEELTVFILRHVPENAPRMTQEELDDLVTFSLINLERA